MKKIQLILIILMLNSCFLAYAEDAISECIKKYQVTKLQEIASHNLVMRPEDRKKYLDQIDVVKQKIATYKEDIAAGHRAIFPDDQAHSVLMRGYSLSDLILGTTICGSSLAIALIIMLEFPDDKKIPGLTIAGIPCLLSLCGVGRAIYKMVKRGQELPQIVYRKLITMEALIKSIPVTDEIVSQKQ